VVRGLPRGSARAAVAGFGLWVLLTISGIGQGPGGCRVRNLNQEVPSRKLGGVSWGIVCLPIARGLLIDVSALGTPVVGLEEARLVLLANPDLDQLLVRVGSQSFRIDDRGHSSRAGRPAYPASQRA